MKKIEKDGGVSERAIFSLSLIAYVKPDKRMEESKKTAGDWCASEREYHSFSREREPMRVKCERDSVILPLALARESVIFSRSHFALTRSCSSARQGVSPSLLSTHARKPVRGFVEPRTASADESVASPCVRWNLPTRESRTRNYYIDINIPL